MSLENPFENQAPQEEVVDSAVENTQEENENLVEKYTKELTEAQEKIDKTMEDYVESGELEATREYQEIQSLLVSAQNDHAFERILSLKSDLQDKIDSLLQPSLIEYQDVQAKIGYAMSGNMEEGERSELNELYEKSNVTPKHPAMEKIMEGYKERYKATH